MKISNFDSQKIKVLNLFLILLVLYIHSYYLEAADYPVAMALQKFTGNNGLSRVAVPLFFLLSGMLFFNGVTKVRQCFQKLRKRIRSLLIPYLLWNIIFVLWYVLLQNLPGVGGFINSDMVGKVTGGTIFNGLKELFWVPAAFQLWFLRDLLFIVLLSSALYYLIKYTKWLSPIIALIAMVVLVGSGFFTAIDYELNRIDGIAFFCLGGCVSMSNSLEQIDRWLSKPVVAIAVIVFFGNAAWQIFGEDFNAWYNSLTALCGCIVVWKGYDWIVSKDSINHKPLTINLLTPYLGYSFFIYLFHEPAFNIIKKIGLKAFGEHEWSLIILYMINPLIMCAVAIVVAKVLQRYIPKTYSILVGGR